MGRSIIWGTGTAGHVSQIRTRTLRPTEPLHRQCPKIMLISLSLSRPIETMKNTVPEIESLDRCVSDKPVRLAWLDDHGHIRCITGRCIDVSSRRVHVEVREQIPLDTRVMLLADGISVAGSTSVKYVTRCEASFILVLDL